MKDDQEVAAERDLKFDSRQIYSNRSNKNSKLFSKNQQSIETVSPTHTDSTEEPTPYNQQMGKQSFKFPDKLTKNEAKKSAVQPKTQQI